MVTSFLESSYCRHISVLPTPVRILLATDLNTGTITSSHYEVFLPFLPGSRRYADPVFQFYLSSLVCSIPLPLVLGTLLSLKSKLCYDRWSVGQSLLE
jgi:hypothetical protein